MAEGPSAHRVGAHMSTAQRQMFHINRRTAVALTCGAAALLLTGAVLTGASPAQAATAPTLGSAESFSVLAAAAVTNTGLTVITGGSLGVSPGTAVSGFPPGIVTTPATIQAGDAAALQAQNDVT